MSKMLSTGIDSESDSIHFNRNRNAETKRSISREGSNRKHGASAPIEHQESNDQTVVLEGVELERCDDSNVAFVPADTKEEIMEDGELEPHSPLALATPAPLTQISLVKQKGKSEKQKTSRSSRKRRKEEKQLQAVMGIHAHGIPFLGRVNSIDVPEEQSMGSEVTSAFLLEVVDFVVGDVCLNRRNQTARVKVHAGPNARTVVPAVALLDTGSPQSFILESVFQRMLKTGAIVPEDVSTTDNRTWSGFGGSPRSTRKRIRLNVQFFDHKSQPTARLAVYAYVVPDGVMVYEVLLGTDSWFRFPVREYLDIRDGETTLKLRQPAAAAVSAVQERKFVAFVESPESEKSRYRVVYNS